MALSFRLSAVDVLEVVEREEDAVLGARGLVLRDLQATDRRDERRGPPRARGRRWERRREGFGDRQTGSQVADHLRDASTGEAGQACQVGRGRAGQPCVTDKGPPSDRPDFRQRALWYQRSGRRNRWPRCRRRGPGRRLGAGRRHPRHWLWSRRRGPRRLSPPRRRRLARDLSRLGRLINRRLAFDLQRHWFRAIGLARAKDQERHQEHKRSI